MKEQKQRVKGSWKAVIGWEGPEEEGLERMWEGMKEDYLDCKYDWEWGEEEEFISFEEWVEDVEEDQILDLWKRVEKKRLVKKREEVLVILKRVKEELRVLNGNTG